MSGMAKICEKCIQKKGSQNVACVVYNIWKNGADWRYLNVDNCPKLLKFFLSEIYRNPHEKIKAHAFVKRLSP